MPQSVDPREPRTSAPGQPPARTTPPAGPSAVWKEARVVAGEAAMARMLRRIAHEIVERNGGAAGIALVGIRTGGLHLAERLRALVTEIEGTQPPLGAVDISLYRDDVFEGLPRPVIGPTELPFELAGVRIVLVDDVLYTGRTVRAALDALMDYGRPRAVQLAVLVDRGLRELPIGADYVGMNVETTPGESIKVILRETAPTDEQTSPTQGDAGERVVVRIRSQP